MNPETRSRKRGAAFTMLTALSLLTIQACGSFGTTATSDGGGVVDPQDASKSENSENEDATAPSSDACAPGSTPVVVASDAGDGGDAGKCSLVVGGVERSDNCYWVPERQPLTFEFANSRCQKPSPKDHIVTIGSASENSFLIETFPTCEERWIGLFTDVASASPEASDFRWTNTAPDAFRAWAPGFPRGDGKCVVIRPDGQWENRPCIEVHTVLCERE